MSARVTARNYLRLDPTAPWRPKARNWRTRYGYRPATILPPYASEIKGQEQAYILWLAKAREIAAKDAEQYARSQPRGEAVTVATGDNASRLRRAEVIGEVTLRTVGKIGARTHFAGPQDEDIYGYASGWQRAFSGIPATTYFVVIGGRLVNSFLTIGGARAFAAKLTTTPGEE